MPDKSTNTANFQEDELVPAVDHTQGEGPGQSTHEGFQTGHVVTVGLAHAMNDTYASFLAPLLPALIGKLAMSKTQAELLAFLQSSPALLQPVIGHLADRVNLRFAVILAPAAAATMMSLLGVAPHYALLALFVMVTGLSSASLHAIAPAMAGRFSGPRLSQGMGFWVLGGYLGLALGPLIAVSGVNLLKLERTPWLMIGGWLGSAILYLRLRDVQQARMRTETNSWRAGFQAMRPILVPVASILAARALLMSATLTFLPTFLTEQGANLWLAGVALSVVHTSSAVGALIAGSTSDRLGRRLVVTVSLLSPALLMMILIRVSGWVQIPALLGLGATVPASQVVLMTLTQEYCPENRALAIGVYSSLTFISESIGAVVLGVLGDLFGLRLAFATGAVILLAGLPLVLLLPKERSQSCKMSAS